MWEGQLTGINCMIIKLGNINPTLINLIIDLYLGVDILQLSFTSLGLKSYLGLGLFILFFILFHSATPNETLKIIE
jgi:hypothetical protein